MKKVLLIGQLTDMSGYGHAARRYYENLIEIEKEGLIELKVLNFSYENLNTLSDSQIEEIKKRSITKKINYKRGFKPDDSDEKLLQQYIDKKDYEVVFCMLNEMLTFGVLNQKCTALANAITDNGHRQIPAFNLYQICANAKNVNCCLVWESSTIPDLWVRAMSDENINLKSIISPSDWFLTEHRKQISKQFTVIPYFYKEHLEIDESYKNKILEATKDKFIFTSVFQWSDRKGPDILIKAFATEFYNEPDVCLILKTYANRAFKDGDETQSIAKEIKNITRGVCNLFDGPVNPKFKTIIINDILNKKQLNSLYQSSDVFVLPTRGEGFCIPALESISSETPVIMPDKGGHMVYIDPDDPFLIESREEPYEGQGSPSHLWCGIKSNWVESSMSSLKQKIRLAYENKKRCVDIGKKQKQYMTSILSKDECTQKFKDLLI